MFYQYRLTVLYFDQIIQIRNLLHSSSIPLKSSFEKDQSQKTY